MLDTWRYNEGLHMHSFLSQFIPKRVSIAAYRKLDLYRCIYQHSYCYTWWCYQGTRYFSECAVSFPIYISSNPNTSENSFIWRLDSSQMHFALFGRRRGWENTRNKNILVVKISAHVSLGGADTREDVSCFCWVRECGMWDWFLIDERIV